MNKPKVGQKVFIRKTGMYSRRSEDATLYTGEVTKVGRKYFSLKSECAHGRRELQFHLEDWRQKTEFTPYYTVFESEQAYRDLVEASGLGDKLRGFFMWGWRNRLPLPALREIKSIIDRYAQTPS